MEITDKIIKDIQKRPSNTREAFFELDRVRYHAIAYLDINKEVSYCCVRCAFSKMRIAAFTEKRNCPLIEACTAVNRSDNKCVYFKEVGNELEEDML